MKLRIPLASLPMRLSLSVIVLAVVLVRAHLSELTLRWGPSVFAGLAGAAALLALALVASAVRWALVLGAQGPPIWFLCRLYFIGWFFSLFLPTSVGGDAARALALSQGATRAGQGVASIVLERMLGVVALVAYFAAGAMVASPPERALLARARLPVARSVALLALCVGSVGLLYLVRAARRAGRVPRVLHEAGELWGQFRRSPSHMLAALGMSLLVQGLYIVTWRELGMTLGVAVPLRDLLFCVPFVSLAAMLPVTLSGLGVREGAWTLLLTPLGITSANAIAFSLSYYAASLAVGVVGGLLFGARGMRPTLARTREVPLVVASPQQDPVRQET